MRTLSTVRRLAVLGTLVAAAQPIAAQDHQHVEGMTHPGSTEASLLSSGQAAYGAIAEIVLRLEKDPATDWSKVNLEALRKHLIDMDNVTLRSRIVTRPVPGGFSADITGDGETVGSIRRMTAAHARALASEGSARAAVTEIPGGARMVVTGGPSGEARLRGLGVIGVMTLGNHHGPHHEGLARGAAVHEHD
jgi:hypothetical protein